MTTRFLTNGEGETFDIGAFRATLQRYFEDLDTVPTLTYESHQFLGLDDDAMTVDEWGL